MGFKGCIVPEGSCSEIILQKDFLYPYTLLPPCLGWMFLSVPPAETAFYWHFFLLFSLSYCEFLEESSYVALVFTFLELKSESGRVSINK